MFSLVDNLKFNDADGEEPSVKSELQIFPATEMVGDVYHPSQEEPLELGQKFFESCVKSFEESGIDIMVDYNHASGMAMSQEDGAAALQPSLSRTAFGSASPGGAGDLTASGWSGVPWRNERLAWSVPWRSERHRLTASWSGAR